VAESSLNAVMNPRIGGGNDRWKVRPLEEDRSRAAGTEKWRAGMRKAKVALARKLAVILHSMLADAKPFNPTAKAATT
jgi:hypothetical protein